MDQSSYEALYAILSTYMVVILAVVVIQIVACWKLYTKADEAGWKAIIPLYNLYIMFKIVWGNGWLFLLLFVPIANIVVSIMHCFKMAKAYGKGTGFGFGLLFLPQIFILILAFGSSEYVGPQN